MIRLTPKPKSTGLKRTPMKRNPPVAKGKFIKIDQKKSRNQTIIIRECTKYIDDQKARIKELENKLKFCEYDNRIKLHETWYWMGDGEDHLESLTCPVIINANDLRDLISQARADQNKKIGEWGNEPCPHRNNDFPFPKAVPTELQMLKRECRDCWQEKFGIAKLQKGEF